MALLACSHFARLRLRLLARLSVGRPTPPEQCGLLTTLGRLHLGIRRPGSPDPGVVRPRVRCSSGWVPCLLYTSDAADDM
eukprot:4832262-Alexandrium_andersonii.AAC.1